MASDSPLDLPVGAAREQTVDDVLRLALDLCIGVGAFAATPTGSVHLVVSDAMPPEDAEYRLEALARSCLTHPANVGRDLFWNAEVSTEAESAERSLACVVQPVWRGQTRVGLLGVADTWLPEPDGEQRAGLAGMADVLARLLPQPAAPRAAGGQVSVGVSPVTDEERGAADLFSTVVHQLRDAVLISRADGTVVMVNAAFGILAGVPPHQLVGKDLSAVLSADGPGERSAPGALNDLLDEPGEPRRLRLLPAGGEPTSVDVTPTLLTGEFGDAVVLVVRPLSASTGAELGIAVDDLVENLDDGVMCFDSAGRVVLANRAANLLHGLAPPRSLVGAQLPRVTALRTEDGHVLAYDHHPGLKVLRDGAPTVAHLTLGDDAEGQRRVSVSARPFNVAGEPGALVVLHDTTAEWMEQQRLTHYALHDPLTSLANRYLLLEELRRMLQGLGRRGGSVALVFLDLDNFKQINDRHGHDVGDEVLTAVARRLKGAVRSDDVVARLGGDEFVIAHASRERLADGDLVVSRVRKVLSAPFRVRGDAFDVGASIGWVSTDTDDVGPDALLARADRAMYRHKRDRTVSRHGGE